VKILTACFQVMVLFFVVMTGNSQSPTESRRSSPIGVGEMAPNFALEDQNKNKITLSDARGKRPVVLVFYRGYW